MNVLQVSGSTLGLNIAILSRKCMATHSPVEKKVPVSRSFEGLMLHVITNKFFNFTMQTWNLRSVLQMENDERF